MGANGALRSLIHLGQSQHSLLCYLKALQFFWGKQFFLQAQYDPEESAHQIKHNKHNPNK